MSFLTMLFRNGNHKDPDQYVGSVNEDVLMDSLWETVKNGPREIQLKEEAEENGQ